MRKKQIKIISLMIIFLYIATAAKIVFGLEATDVVGDGTTFGASGVDTFYNVANVVLGIIQYASGGAAVIATLVLAMRYMYSAPDEKAEIKKKMLPFVIGAVLVFGAVSLVKLVETFSGELL